MCHWNGRRERATRSRGQSGTYLRIVGGACILNALIPISSSYLRAFGYTKYPLAATLGGNVVNLILNAVFLFVCGWGVAGVALSTVLSRAVNLAIVMLLSHMLIRVEKCKERIPDGVILRQIIRVGLPAACETALYNLAMTLTIRFLNQMDADGVNVTARSYAIQITNFSYCVGAALAQANAILTGWRMGAGDYEACDRGTRKAAVLGVAVAVILESCFALFSGSLMKLFTSDPEMIALVGRLLMIDIILEIGRCSNLVYGQALKTSGDAVFPTAIGAVFMYICMVGGTWFFGIQKGLLVTGAYIAMASDECVRAVCMYLRWKSGRWREKGFVRNGRNVVN